MVIVVYLVPDNPNMTLYSNFQDKKRQVRPVLVELICSNLNLSFAYLDFTLLL